MRKYSAYFKMCMMQMVTYKADYILYMSINTVFFYISIALWYTIYKSGNIDQISSYTISNTITYYLLTSLIFRFDMAGTIYLGEEIWNGDFTNDLIKPWHVIKSHIAATAADIAIGLTSFAPFLVIMFITSLKYMSLPSTQNLLICIFTILLSTLMNFFFNMIFHAMTFHHGDRRSLIELVNFITGFLAGSMFPLAFLNGSIKTIFMSLPFKYIFYIPIEIFLGKLEIIDILTSWIIIVAWTAVFYIIFRIIYNTGLKKYEGTGR